MKTTILVLITMFIFSHCKKDAVSEIVYQYSVPVKYEDDIETASLESVNMNKDNICAMIDYINSVEQNNIHNILIFRNNKLVFEQYFQGNALNFNIADLNGEQMEYNRETDHFIASISKSVTSVIVGVAINMGYISDLNKKIIDYFPEYADILIDGKENITVENLLTMRCGLEFDENTFLYNDPRSDTYQMINSQDPLRYVLSKPLITTPGTEFHYNTGTTNILAAIIAKETGETFFNWANANFFDAMNIEGGKWSMMANGVPLASGGLYLRARELSKIGLMFLNDGMWLGKQFIAANWIEKSVHEHVSVGNSFFENTSYGYQWWISNLTVNKKACKCYFGAGWGDQFLFVIPELELVVEFNSGNFAGAGKISPLNLLYDYILKAVND